MKTTYEAAVVDRRAAVWPSAPAPSGGRLRQQREKRGAGAVHVVPEDMPLSLGAAASPDRVTLGLPEHLPDGTWNHEVVAFQFIPEHLPCSKRRSLFEVDEVNRMKDNRARALSAWQEESSASICYSRSDSIQSRAAEGEECGCGHGAAHPACLTCSTCTPSDSGQPALTLRVKGINAIFPTPLPGVVVNTGGVSGVSSYES